ncbi:MAG TPA: EamA family transporter [Candidatus Limnocylindrales bacterium]|nr:EamA family transporter [Candidatus Limnocylindrales bacterium]
MRDRTAVLMVLAAALMWGTTGTARALAPENAAPLAVGAVRIVIGGAVLVLIALARGTLLGARGSRPRWPILAAAISAIAVAIYQLAFFEGVARVGVAVGTIVAIGSAPAFAGALAWIALRERPSTRWLVATAVAVAGLVLLVLQSPEAALEPRATLLPLTAGAGYAVYATASKRMLRAGDSVAVAAIAFGGGALLLLPLLFTVDLAWLREPRGVAVALELGVVATALAYILFTRALTRLPVSWSATLSLAEPLTASLLGVAILRESLAPLQIVGAALVAAGLVSLATAPATDALLPETSS